MLLLLTDSPEPHVRNSAYLTVFLFCIVKLHVMSLAVPARGEIFDAVLPLLCPTTPVSVDDFRILCYTIAWAARSATARRCHCARPLRHSPMPRTSSRSPPTCCLCLSRRANGTRRAALWSCVRQCWRLQDGSSGFFRTVFRAVTAAAVEAAFVCLRRFSYSS
jgi:hypothetical protein